ncbi:MAG: tetratricopeptide repeat protein, partial [candidate division KSB1 bacterium]|nr:tetratricopeptide repeat protein [candidate division KSB1 bacterium]
YLDKDYEKAVELFSKVEPISQSDTSLSEAWRREFFFHYGLAVLGKSGGKSLHRKNYAEAARLFEKALTCCPPQEDADAVRFFLGLSLFLQGEKPAAAAYLKEISSASSFYRHAQKMISP